MELFIPLTKVDEEKRLVYGIVTEELRDRSGEICDYATTKPYYEKWSSDFKKVTDGRSLGNIRAMHGKVAVGKAVDLSYNDERKQITLCAKIIDDNEWRKCLDGVYTGFSHGGAYVKRWDDPDHPGTKRYTANPGEISLVDLPCLPSATFEVVKLDGSGELRKFAVDMKIEARKLLIKIWGELDHPRDGKGLFTESSGIRSAIANVAGSTVGGFAGERAGLALGTAAGVYLGGSAGAALGGKLGSAAGAAVGSFVGSHVNSLLPKTEEQKKAEKRKELAIKIVTHMEQLHQSHAHKSIAITMLKGNTP